MFKTNELLRVLLACGIASLMLSATAVAQSPATVNPYRARMATPPPTVSPYLNLNVDSNGLSNYGSLVRPMLTQRAMMEKQREQEQLQVRPQLAQGRSTGQVAETKPSSGRASGTFMNYSHYFGGGR
jgi:hypothetical protein